MYGYPGRGSTNDFTFESNTKNTNDPMRIRPKKITLERKRNVSGYLGCKSSSHDSQSLVGRILSDQSIRILSANSQPAFHAFSNKFILTLTVTHFGTVFEFKGLQI